MNKIELWYLVSDGGDGSAYPNFYLTKEETEELDEVNQLDQYTQGFAETCNGMVETFEGSNIHLKAIKNSEGLPELLKELREVYNEG